MSTIAEIKPDNDCGAFVRECLDSGLAGARRVLIIAESQDGIWSGYWMNAKPWHKAYAAALLMQQSTDATAFIPDGKTGT